MDNFKETTLKGHISLCELRYKALEERLDKVENKLHKLEQNVTDIKTQTASGFAEIKLMLERQNSSKQTQLIATIGTVAVAVIGLIGYIITR
jgi:predicted  nucleic acid-binding Zn-ribbon protein